MKPLTFREDSSNVEVLEIRSEWEKVPPSEAQKGTPDTHRVCLLGRGTVSKLINTSVIDLLSIIKHARLESRVLIDPYGQSHYLWLLISKIFLVYSFLNFTFFLLIFSRQVGR